MTNTIAPAPAPVVKARPAVGWTELSIGALSYVLVLPALVIVPLMVAGVEIDTVAALGIGVVATLGAVAIALLPRIRSLAPLRLGNPGPRWLLAGLAAGLGAYLVNRLVVVGWITLTGDASNPQQYLADAAASGGWTLVATMVLGGLLIPFAEELLFRGIGYSALRRYGRWVAILGSAAIFGIAHGFSVVLVGAFVIGVVNAWLFDRSGSVWPSVIAHAANNIVIFSLVAALA